MMNAHSVDVYIKILFFLETKTLLIVIQYINLKDKLNTFATGENQSTHFQCTLII